MIVARKSRSRCKIAGAAGVAGINGKYFYTCKKSGTKRAGAFAVVSHGDESTINSSNGADIARIMALAAWRITKGIYKFDKTILESLIDTPIDKELPIELFYQLPEWCVYVDLSDAGIRNVVGFFAHLEYDINTGRHELRFLADTNADANDLLMPIVLHLHEGVTLKECLSLAADESMRQQMERQKFIDPNTLKYVDITIKLAQPFVSLLLYLCSAKPDVRKKNEQNKSGATSKVIAGKEKIFPATVPITWEVGYRIGKTLRSAWGDLESGGNGEAAGTDQRSGHVRRAHWHTFITGEGSRKDPTKAIRKVKWLPPIPVNLPDFDEVIPTIHKVK